MMASVPSLSRALGVPPETLTLVEVPEAFPLVEVEPVRLDVVGAIV